MNRIIRIPKNADFGTVKIEGAIGKAHISITAEDGSRATFIEEISGNGNRKETVEIIAKPNSEIRFAAVQKIGKGINNVSRKAVVGRNANVEWLDIVTGSSVTKSETISELTGEGAKSSMFTVFFGNKKQKFEFLNKCVHAEKNTESLILSSGALKDSSKAVQKSFSKIGEKAYNASARQKTRIMLLNEGTEALPIPELEIGNNEVSATHEAAVGRIDEEKTFYLMSRGISESDARKTLVKGFFEQFASKMNSAELMKETQGIIEAKMEND